MESVGKLCQPHTNENLKCFEKTQFKKTSSLYPSLYGFCFKLQQNFSSDAVFFQQLG